jgi:hypothetical protein
MGCLAGRTLDRARPTAFLASGMKGFARHMPCLAGGMKGFGTPDALFGRPNLCSGGPNACSSGQNQRFFPPESPVF